MQGNRDGSATAEGTVNGYRNRTRRRNIGGGYCAV